MKKTKTTSRQIPLAWLLQGEPSSCNECNQCNFWNGNAVRADHAISHIGRKHFFVTTRTKKTTRTKDQEKCSRGCRASPLHHFFQASRPTLSTIAMQLLVKERLWSIAWEEDVMIAEDGNRFPCELPFDKYNLHDCWEALTWAWKIILWAPKNI